MSKTPHADKDDTKRVASAGPTDNKADSARDAKVQEQTDPKAKADTTGTQEGASGVPEHDEQRKARDKEYAERAPGAAQRAEQAANSPSAAEKQNPELAQLRTQAEHDKPLTDDAATQQQRATLGQSVTVGEAQAAQGGGKPLGPGDTNARLEALEEGLRQVKAHIGMTVR